jgi:hypothetical protein
MARRWESKAGRSNLKIRMPNAEDRAGCSQRIHGLRIFGFGLLLTFVIRHSDFVLAYKPAAKL